MKIAITGGAGYVGCRLSEQLLNNGHEVICIDWLKYGVQPILNILDRKGFHLHKIDICSPEVEPILKSADAVIHLAGIVGYPSCEREPDLAYSVNVEGTNRVIDASVGKPFVYASTGSVYGELGKTCDETCETNPISTYSVYKLDGEKKLKGTDAVILRPATAFGVSNRLRQDLLVNDFTYKAIAEKKLVLFEKHFKRTFLSINDLARSFRWALEKYDIMKGEIWNVGDETLNHTKLDIAQIIKSKVDYELIINDELSHDKDGRDYFVDYTKIRNIGFTATETLEDGIDSLVKLYHAA
ncbi:MAG: epimerase [Gammaproteobacteria bacterium]|nr:epimerase [Gammaproteobacteria bacterium]